MAGRSLASSRSSSPRYRAEDKDITDVVWFCENKLNGVTAITSQIDYQSRLSFASDAKASESAGFDGICQGLQLEPSQVL